MTEQEFIEKIGELAIGAGWKPDSPIADSFGSDGSQKERKRIIGRSFLQQNAEKIQSAVCVNGMPRPTVKRTTSIACFIAGVLTGQSEFIIEPEQAGKIIAEFGLESFCAANFSSLNHA